MLAILFSWEALSLLSNAKAQTLISSLEARVYSPIWPLEELKQGVLRLFGNSSCIEHKSHPFACFS